MKVFIKTFLLFLFCCASFRGHAQSNAGTISGAATFCSCTNSGFLALVGYSGAIQGWESSTDGGLNWTSTSNILNQQSYTNLCQTTCYRAIVMAAGFPPDTSAMACMTVYQPSAGGTISGGGTFCGGSGNGTLTLTGNTGNPVNWQYSTDNGVTWLSVANTSTTLNYTNISQNTIYEAVVQNGPSCPSDTSTQSAFVIDALSSAGTISGNDTVCYGANSGTISLSGITGNVLTWAYSVDTGTSWTPIPNITTTQNYSNLTQQTLYAAIVQNNSCPADTSAAVTIDVFAPFPVSAGNDTMIDLGTSLVLNGSGTGAAIWSPATGLNSTTLFTPTSTPSADIVYTLTVLDSNGCTNSDNVTITVIFPQFNGMISNLFTPNADGINDTWYIQDIDKFPGNEVFVYNIYGNKVYEKKDYMNDWKGTYNGADLPDGTYYYILKFDAGSKPHKGSVDILRNK